MNTPSFLNTTPHPNPQPAPKQSPTFSQAITPSVPSLPPPVCWDRGISAG